MRVLNTELRLRFKNRKPRPFNRAASADDATTTTATPAEAEAESEAAGVNGQQRQRLNRIVSMRMYCKKKNKVGRVQLRECESVRACLGESERALISISLVS